MYCKFEFSWKGCHTRAHIFSKKLTEAVRKKYPESIFELPKKHFVFGSLRYKTAHYIPNHPSIPKGEVRWYMHVAPLIKLLDKNKNDHELFILDPGVRTIPITLEEWNKRITSNPSQDISGQE